MYDWFMNTPLTAIFEPFSKNARFSVTRDIQAKMKNKMDVM